MHSGLQSSKFTMGSPAYNASSRTFQKGPTPLTDQQAHPPPKTQLKKKDDQRHSKKNVLLNATQSNPSPPAITTAPLDPWKLIDQELEIKIKNTYKNVVNCKPHFIVLSKNKPGFNIIELLNQQLIMTTNDNQLSLVEETPNSDAAMILPHLSLPKTKSETNGSNS